MQKPIRVGINGFGRIGRKVARLAFARDNIEIAAINDLGKPEQMAHLLKYDSVHGTWPEEITLDGSTLCIGNRRIPILSEKDPTQIPWGKMGIDFVHECTGIFTDREKAALHLQGGAKKVIISAPSKNPDVTLCLGVNESMYDPSKHAVVSNASCTTNCLAPMVKVLDDNFGVIRGLMVTIHSYTNDQQLLDLPHKDLRRARAAAVSQIPTTTGAAKAVGLVLPHLKGKLEGFAIRVPTPNVSLVDFTCELKKSTSKDEINAAFKKAAEGAMKGILAYSKVPLVSCDFNGSILSSTVDADLTHVMEGTMAKTVSWYDNESGYSARMLDLTLFMAQKGL